MGDRLIAQERDVPEGERFLKDYHNIISTARDHLNFKKKYIEAYDLAVQALFLARHYLSDDRLILESEIIKGLALLEIDSFRGHEFLENLYNQYIEKTVSLLKTDIDLKLRLKSALAVAKTFIGDYDCCIEIVSEILKESYERIEECKKNQEDFKNHIRRIIKGMNIICYCLIYKSRHRKYPFRVKIIEEYLDNMGIDNLSIHDIYNRLNSREMNLEIKNELEEAIKYLNEGIRLSKEYQIRDFELVSYVNKACVLVEKEEYEEALEKLGWIIKDKHIQDFYLGYCLNEVAICRINLEQFDGIPDLLKQAWDWAYKNNHLNLLDRNCYASALYYFKLGNLDLAYSFADITYRKNDELPTLKLLYDICLIKYIQAYRQRNDKEYALYRSEYEKYKNMLERRG